MVYEIRQRGEVIGTSALEHFDDGMSVASGALRPAAAYERVRAVFRLYAEAVPATSAEAADEATLARYYRERDALDLELVDASGRVVPTGFIHISDFTEEAGADAYQIEVQIADRRAWDAARVARPTG